MADALEATRRVVEVEAAPGRIAVAYTQQIVAVGAFAESAARLVPPTDLRGRVPVDERLRVTGSRTSGRSGSAPPWPMAEVTIY